MIKHVTGVRVPFGINLTSLNSEVNKFGITSTTLQRSLADNWKQNDHGAVDKFTEDTV